MQALCQELPCFFDSSVLSVNSEGMRSFRTNCGGNNNYSQGSKPISYKRLLIGYPSQDREKGSFSITYRGQQQVNNFNGQGNKGKGVVTIVHSSADDKVPVKGKAVGSKEKMVSLSKEQYHQFLGMMQRFKDQNVSTGTIDFAGPFNEEAFGDW